MAAETLIGIQVMAQITGMAQGAGNTQPFVEHPETETLADIEIDEPRFFEVVLHNDDYTTMDFVVAILVEVFRKTLDQAASIMLSVHQKGAGVAGVYCQEIAETKVEAVRERAREAEYPLRCTLREVAP